MRTYNELASENKVLDEKNGVLSDKIHALEALLRAERERAEVEREKREHAEEQRALVERQLEALRKSHVILQQELELLRRRIFETKAERVDASQLELEFARTKAALDEVQKQIAATEEAQAITPPAPPAPSAPAKNKPTGRRRLADLDLPEERIVIRDEAMEMLVLEGKAKLIGADESSTLKYRRGALVRVVVEKNTYQHLALLGTGQSTLTTAAAPKTIIERSIGTPSLYANIATEKFERGMPLFRQEERFVASGVEVDRGLMSRWLEALGATLGATVLHAMRKDAFANAMCLATDATGILIQRGRDPSSKARRPCKKGHFFVQIADRDAVFFEYAEKETSAAVREMFRGFSGYVQADAKNVYDILYREPDEPPDADVDADAVCIEVGCWAHTRRYFFEAAMVAKEPVAREALYRIRRIYELESKWSKGTPPSTRKTLRQKFMRPELDAFFEFVESEYVKVEHQRGLLRSALVYAKNQRRALLRFLEDGHLRIDNNASERALRRVAVGRKNWLFVGSDDHAIATANLLSMIATAKLHDLDPESYLRDLFRVLPHWPKERHLELAPKRWSATKARLSESELSTELGPLTVPAAES